MSARHSFILMSGYCVTEKVVSSRLSCALVKVVRFRRRAVSERALNAASRRAAGRAKCNKINLQLRFFGMLKVI